MSTKLAMLALVLFPGLSAAQYTDPGGDPRYGNGGRAPVNYVRAEPIITVVELRGPLPPDEFREMFALSDAQAGVYGAVLDSFNVLTRKDRDEAVRRVEQLGTAISKRDSAAAEYYRDHVRILGKSLKAQQSKFDDRVKKLLTKDQQKAYKDYRKKQDEAARNPPADKNRDPARPPG